MFESIINDEILDELLKQAGISNDTSVRKDLTPEKAASKIFFQPYNSHWFDFGFDTKLADTKIWINYLKKDLVELVQSWFKSAKFLLDDHLKHSTNVIFFQVPVKFYQIQDWSWYRCIKNDFSLFIFLSTYIYKSLLSAELETIYFPISKFLQKFYYYHFSASLGTIQIYIGLLQSPIIDFIF